MNTDDYLRRAVELATRNMREGKGGPFGAVIVRDNRIIAEGCNVVTSENDPTCHAEMQAIRAACKALGTFKLEGCVIYSSCEPCPMCLSAIYWARFDRLYFAGSRQDAAHGGFDDEFLYNELKLPIEKRAIPTAQSLKGEGRKPLDEWNRKQDKIPY